MIYVCLPSVHLCLQLRRFRWWKWRLHQHHCGDLLCLMTCFDRSTIFSCLHQSAAPHSTLSFTSTWSSVRISRVRAGKRTQVLRVRSSCFGSLATLQQRHRENVIDGDVFRNNYLTTTDILRLCDKAAGSCKCLRLECCNAIA